MPESTENVTQMPEAGKKDKEKDKKKKVEKEYTPTYYYVGSTYTPDGTALHFAMSAAVNSPGIEHKELKQKIIDGYVRKSGVKADNAYAQQLINYAVKNGNLVTEKSKSPGKIPEREKKASKAKMSETAVALLEAIKKKAQTRDELAGTLGKPKVSLGRSLNKLIDDGLVASDGADDPKYSITDTGTKALDQQKQAA